MVDVQRGPYIIRVMPRSSTQGRRPGQVLNHVLTRGPWSLIINVKPLGIPELLQAKLRMEKLICNSRVPDSKATARGVGIAHEIAIFL